MPVIDLSILIPCYNKEQYIDECIASIKEQTLQPKEILLAHDGCKEPNAHIDATTIIFTKNRGVQKVRDELVRFSSCELILFLDADDKLAPDYLERMIYKMPKVEIVYPNIFWWYGNGFNRIGDTPDKLLPKDMFNSCKIPVTCMMKKFVYKELGGFRDFPMFEDWDFWLRAMVKGYKFEKANTMLYYRQAKNTRNRAEKEEKEKVYKQIRSQFELKRGKLCLKD
jgi:glycosyltransferase involved in cell wall biosynthesis